MELSFKKIAAIVVLIFVGVFGYLWHTNYFVQKEATDYNRLRDLSRAYDATEEIKAAKAKLQQGVTPALVIKNGPIDKKKCALTFDGMADTATTDRILDLLAKHKAKGTFFAEGINVAADPKIVTAIVQGGQKVGNYTYVGLGNVEKLPVDKALEEICTAQKVLKITTDFTPKLFKGANTEYTPQLLKELKAAGIDYAVQSTNYLEARNITDQNAANIFVAGLKPGAIVSMRLGIPGEIKKEKGKTDERPAIDKQPGLDALPEPGRQGNAADALEKVLIALAAQKYELVYVEDFSSTATAAASAKTAGLWYSLQEFVTNNLGMRTAYAAPKAQASKVGKVTQDTVNAVKEAAKDVVRDPKEVQAYKEGNLSSVSPENPTKPAAPVSNVGAKEEKMLYTVDRAVPFTFTGLEKPNAVRNVLQALRDTASTGTFFVTEQEIRRYGDLISEILADGNELGIAVRPRASEDYDKIKATIVETHNMLSNNYGVNSTLVKQFSGPVRDETKQAIEDLGYRLIGYTVNVVQTKHKSAKTSAEVMKDIFGPKVFSVGRGWVVQIRMDFYDNEQLAADMFRAIKKEKIDNIAYRSYYDMPESNPNNDSSYVVKPVGSILSDRATEWTYPVPDNAILPSMAMTPTLENSSEKEFMKETKKRYIGFKWVNEDDRMLGFSTVEADGMDKTGLIHTNDPVVFFTFDDWGTDVSINRLLYVLHKHNVRGNFFVLTHNVIHNPNLLRAIAMEGHDICAHSNAHKPLAVRKNGSSRQYPTQTPEEILADGKECYRRLLSITGDIDYDGEPVLTKYYRPPTLAISKVGLKALFNDGYEYIVAGYASTEDYSAPSLKTMLNRITDAIYYKGKVRKGAVLVMHMSDTSKFTALALDLVLTANEKRAYDDPARFTVGRLSDYLVPGYDQSQPFTYR